MKDTVPPDGGPSPQKPDREAESRRPGRSSTTRLRAWIPAAALILATANIVRLHAATDLDAMMRNMYTTLTWAATLVALIIWWLFLTKLRWRTRFAGIAVAILCAGGLKWLLRVDGSDGGGRPRIVWRWTPRKSGEVGGFKAGRAAPGLSESAAAADYPGYLGHERSGVIPNAQLDPDWSAHPPRELWRQPIGLGWSAFAVSGPRAITQEQRGENEMITCYDLATGSPIWSHANAIRFSEPMGGDGPRTTPTIDRGRVYALGATGILDCLDVATGRLIWTADTLKQAGVPNTHFGKCSSPLIVDDLVIVTGGMAKDATLLAFQCQDGAPAWRAGHDESEFQLAGTRHPRRRAADSLRQCSQRHGARFQGWTHPLGILLGRQQMAQMRSLSCSMGIVSWCPRVPTPAARCCRSNPQRPASSPSPKSGRTGT